MFGRAGRWLRWTLWLGLSALSSVSGAHEAMARQVVDAGNERYESRRLANGLQVALAEDHRVPLVGISISYPVGEIQDPTDAAGAAALIANLLPALGTRHLPQGSDDLLAAAGFYPWRVEALTQGHETFLSLLVPASAIDLALFIEADRMGFAGDGVTSALVDWARARVQRSFEAKSGGERVSMLLGQLLYGPQHPYWADGAAPALDKLDLDWVRARIRRYYGVSGAKLSIVGDIDSKRVLATLERTFGRLQGRAAASPVLPPPSALSLPAEVRAADALDAVVWGWRTPRYLHDDDVALDVVARYLTHRLAQRLAVGDKRSAARARQVSMSFGSAFWLALPVAEGTPRAAVEAMARAELDALSAGNAVPTELELAKTTIEREIADNMDELTARARFMSRYVEVYGKSDGFQAHLQSYEQVDAKRVAEVVKRNLGTGNVVLGSVREAGAKQPVVTALPKATYRPPMGEEQLRTPDSVEWYRPPGVVTTPRFEPPRVFELALGKSRLLYLPRAGLPTVKLRVALHWQGLAPIPAMRTLALRCLLRSKRGASARLGDRLSDLGASLEVKNDQDAFSLTVTAAPERADDVMVAIRETLEIERFDADTFVGVHEELVKELAEAKANEWQLAYHWIQRLEYPSTHRYHTREVSPDARLAVLRSIDRKQLEVFWRGERRAESLTVAIVGPVDEARARTLGGLALPRYPVGKPSANSRLSPTKGLFLVEGPAASGSDVRVQFSWPVPKRDEPGHADAMALRGLFAKTPAFLKLLKENGVSSPEDWFANVLTEREQSHLVFALRVPRAELGGVLKAVRLYGDSLRKGDMTWTVVQEARREVLQWVVERFRGASGCMGVLAAQADWQTSTTSTGDLYLLAQRIDKGSLTKAAALLAPELASVLAYGAVAGLETELTETAYGKPQLPPTDKKGRP